MVSWLSLQRRSKIYCVAKITDFFLKLICNCDQLEIKAIQKHLNYFNWHNFRKTFKNASVAMKLSDSLLVKMVIGILILLIAGFLFWRYSTKAYSPEDISTYSDGAFKMEVVYNRPYKKDRDIFGKLVPYNEVWRTGANEATTFTTNSDIYVDGSLLNEGTYTLWTIPMENSWKVIFNSKMYPWGINLEKKAYREEEFDVLVVEVPTRNLQESLEQFSIYFEKANELVLFNLAWDKTKVTLPIKR